MAEIIKNMDNRRAFIETLTELAEKDPMVMLIICDVGFNYCEEFAKRFPKQFKNLGVTEQSAMIIAAALALSGFKVYYYSMINFSLFRPAEMVRNAVVCHKAPVTIIGVKGSTSYKFLGFSHNLLHEKEDFDFCRNIGLQAMHPKTVEDVKEFITETYVNPRARYIRL